MKKTREKRDVLTVIEERFALYDSKQTLAVGEMANVLGISYMKAWRAVVSGKVIGWKIGRDWVVDAKSVKEHMLESSNQPSS